MFFAHLTRSGRVEGRKAVYIFHCPLPDYGKETLLCIKFRTLSLKGRNGEKNALKFPLRCD